MNKLDELDSLRRKVEKIVIEIDVGELSINEGTEQIIDLVKKYHESK